jgi:hypothetical protein
VYGPAIAALFGLHTIIEDEAGTFPVRPGTLVLTQAPRLDALHIDDVIAAAKLTCPGWPSISRAVQAAPRSASMRPESQ